MHPDFISADNITKYLLSGPANQWADKGVQPVTVVEIFRSKGGKGRTHLAEVRNPAGKQWLVPCKHIRCTWDAYFRAVEDPWGEYQDLENVRADDQGVIYHAEKTGTEKYEFVHLRRR